LAFYFHILTTMHGQNHIKKGRILKKSMLKSAKKNAWPGGVKILL